jgi:hypothetical protein
MPAKSDSKKLNTSIRLEPDLRKKLEAIADLEFRSLANQIHLFLLYATEDYIQTHNLEFDAKEGRFKNANTSSKRPLRVEFPSSAFDEPVLPKIESAQPPNVHSSRPQK